MLKLKLRQVTDYNIGNFLNENGDVLKMVSLTAYNNGIAKLKITNPSGQSSELNIQADYTLSELIVNESNFAEIENVMSRMGIDEKLQFCRS